MNLLKLTQSNSSTIYFNTDNISHITVSSSAAKGRDVVSIVTNCPNSSFAANVHEVQESIDEVLRLLENC